MMGLSLFAWGDLPFLPAVAPHECYWLVILVVAGHLLVWGIPAGWLWFRRENDPPPNESGLPRSASTGTMSGGEPGTEPASSGP